MNYGVRTNAISSNTAHAAECGFRRKTKIRCCCMRPRVSRQRASEQSIYAPAGWSPHSSRHSMASHSCAFSKHYSSTAPMASVWSWYWITPGTTTRALQPWLRTQRKVLKLLFLPPYSPELNPIERVWKLTRRLATHNRHFPTLEDVINAVTERFALWARPNRQLVKLCAII